MEHLFPEECKRKPLKNINLEWLLMELIGYETGDYSLKSQNSAMFSTSRMWITPNFPYIILKIYQPIGSNHERL